VGLIVGSFISSFFGTLGGDAGHYVDSLLHTSFPIWSIGIVIGAAGFCLIIYKILEEKFGKGGHKELGEELRRQLQKEELDQIDRQNNEGSENDDRYTPANIR
jgi:hypothetical protein